MQKLGIMRGHGHFMGPVVFPILSLEGDVLGMYGRKITAGPRTGTPLRTDVPGPHRGVWKEIMAYESILDAPTRCLHPLQVPRKLRLRSAKQRGGSLEPRSRRPKSLHRRWQQPTATIQALAYRAAGHLTEAARRGEL